MPGLAFRQTYSRASTVLSRLAGLVALALGSTSCGGGSSDPTAATAAPVEILATGAMVEGFGQLGEGGAYLIDLDDSGRVLIGGTLDDGRTGLFAGDGGPLTTLWISGSEGVAISPFTAATSPDGRIAAVAADAKSIAVFENDQWRAVISAGDDNGDGARFCDFSTVFINDEGHLAFEARAAATACADVHTFDVYTLAAGAPQSVASPPLLADGSLGFLVLNGISADDRAIVTRRDLSETVDVVAAGNGQTRSLVQRGALSDAGSPLRYIFAGAANRAGNVWFAAKEVYDEDGFGPFGGYRTEEDGVVTVALGGGFVAPNLSLVTLFSFGERNRVSDDGDVLLGGVWSVVEQGRAIPSTDKAVLVGPDGGATLVWQPGPIPELEANDTSAGIGLLNNARQVALRLHAPRGRHTDSIVRWDAGTFTHIAGSGDPSPAGGTLVGYGFGSTACLASDGAVAVSATAANGHDGFVCGDREGFRSIAKTGDRDAQGEAISDFSTFGNPPLCRFSANAVLFIADQKLWRSSKTGLERIAGDTGSGGVVGPRLVEYFDANETGTVALSGYDGYDSALFLLRGDEISRLGPPFPGTEEGLRVGGFGPAVALAEGDEILIPALVGDDSNSHDSLQAWRDGRVGEVLDLRDVGDGQTFFNTLQAKGRHALVGTGEPWEVLRIDLDTGRREVLAGPGTPLGSTAVTYAAGIDISPAGRALITFATFGPGEPFYARYAIVEADGAVTFLDDGSTPLGLAANGAVLSIDSSPVGSARQSLKLTGGLQGSHCF